MRTRIVFLIAVLALTSGASGEDHRATSLELNEQAIALVKLGSYEEAIKLFREARMLMPADPTLRKNLAATHSQLGVKYVVEGKLTEAIAQLRMAVSLEPGTGLYHLNLGIALVRAKQADEAVQSFEKAIRVDPKSALAYYELGNLKYREGQLDDAVKHLTRAAGIDRGNTDYRDALARAKREHSAEKRFTKQESAHFILSWDGEQDASLGARVLRVLEDAFEKTGVDLEIYPKGKVRVVLYTTTEFRKVTGVHGWVTGLYDGRIRIPVKDFSEAEREIRGTIYHEYTHVAVQSITTRCPAWLNEGLAQVYEERPRTAAAARVRSAARSRKLIPILNLRLPFTRFSDVETARLAYAQSLCLVLYIMDQHGPDRIGRFLRHLGEGMPEHEAAEDAFHRSIGDIFEAWKESL